MSLSEEIIFKMEKQSIFVGLTDIAGYYAFLSNELARQGYDVSFFNAKHNPKTPKVNGVGLRPPTRLMRIILCCHLFFFN